MSWWNSCKKDMLSHTDNYVKVVFPVQDDRDLVGEIVPVQVLEADSAGVTGRLLGKKG